MEKAQSGICNMNIIRNIRDQLTVNNQGMIGQIKLCDGSFEGMGRGWKNGLDDFDYYGEEQDFSSSTLALEDKPEFKHREGIVDDTFIIVSPPSPITETKYSLGLKIKKAILGVFKSK